MEIEGGCYCGALRYKAEGDPLFKGQCHCRECQYISGGSPNVTMGMPEGGFAYTKGSPAQFRRSDLKTPVTREFCAECGTHIAARPPGMPAVLLKAGTLDDPSDFGGARDGHLSLRQAELSPDPGRRADLRQDAWLGDVRAGPETLPHCAEMRATSGRPPGVQSSSFHLSWNSISSSEPPRSCSMLIVASEGTETRSPATWMRKRWPCSMQSASRRSFRTNCFAG